MLGQLVAYVTSLGVEPITGKPYKPTTQGKNERFHQTLFRFLDKQPLAETLEQLQLQLQLQEQIDRFDQIYNTERPHQGLRAGSPRPRRGRRRRKLNRLARPRGPLRSCLTVFG